MFNFDHISISVDNLEETIMFYKKFGFELYKEYHDEIIDIVMLKFNEIFMEIFHYKENNPLPEFSKDIDKDLRTIGAKHFGFNVKDINEAKKWAEENLTNEEIVIHHGRLGCDYFFVKDPNGIFVEIIEKR